MRDWAFFVPTTFHGDRPYANEAGHLRCHDCERSRMERRPLDGQHAHEGRSACAGGGVGESGSGSMAASEDDTAATAANVSNEGS